MSDALVFGARNSQASNVADALSDMLRVPVRYKREAADDGRPGVAICVNAESFTTDAGILVYADDVLRDPKTADADREAALGVLGEALARGRYVAVLPSKDAAKHWKSHLKAAGVPAGQQLQRVYVAGWDDGGTFGSQVAAALSLPIALTDPETWSEDAGELAERLEHIEEAILGERWLVSSGYWRAAEILAPRAGLVIHLDFADAGDGTRHESASPPRLTERLLVGALKRGIPLSDEKLLRNKLAEVAHLTPVLRVRNEAERVAVLAGLLRGAAAAAQGAESTV